MWEYSEKVKDHFFQPRNAKVVEGANAIGDVGSISCGDALRLMLRVNEDSEIIEDAGFQTFGCGSAIASSSALTELIIGKNLDESLKVSNQEIADYLDGLPPEKMHCSVMGMEALQAAVANYRGETIEDDHEEGELICKCFAIDDMMIKKVVAKNKLTTLQEVVNYTKAGGACTSCHEKIEYLLDDILASQPTPEQKEDDPRIPVILQVIDKLRPVFERDGGDIRFADISNDLVFIELHGNCSGCGLADKTVQMFEDELNAVLDSPVSVFVEPIKPEAMAGGL